MTDRWRHNALVTITCPHGSVLEARVLSHKDNEIRAVAAGYDDALLFTCINGTWISEEIEPVNIQFAWKRFSASHVTSEDNCVCSKELAARLIHSLSVGSEPETEPDTPQALDSYELNPTGDPIAAQRPELRLT